MNKSENNANLNASNETLEQAKKRIETKYQFKGILAAEETSSVFEDGVNWILNKTNSWEQHFDKQFPNIIVEMIDNKHYSIHNELKNFIRDLVRINVENKKNDLFIEINKLYMRFMENYGIAFENIHIKPSDHQELLDYFREINYIDETITILKEITIYGNIVNVIIENTQDPNFIRYFSSNINFKKTFQIAANNPLQQAPAKIGYWTGNVNEIYQRNS